jgi:hypothetical protein
MFKRADIDDGDQALMDRDPAGAPFNVQGKRNIYVTYAKQNASGHDATDRDGLCGHPRLQANGRRD